MTAPASSRLRLLPLLVAGLLAAALPGPARAATHDVEIVDFAFAPATLTITAGDTVRWTNSDAVEHTATSMSGAFDSGLLAQGESYSMTFTTPGTYDYLCTPHPTMTGRIVVVAAASPSAPAPSASAAPATDGGLPNVAMERASPPPRTPAALVGAALLAAAALLARGRIRRARRTA